MRTYHIIAIIMLVLAYKPILAQTDPIVEEPYREVPFYTCMDCDENLVWDTPIEGTEDDGTTKIESGIKIAVSCTDRTYESKDPTNATTSGNNSEDNLIIRYEDGANNLHIFPEKDNAIIYTVGTSLNINFWHDGQKEQSGPNGEDDKNLWLFVGKATNNGRNYEDVTKTTLQNRTTGFYTKSGYRLTSLGPDSNHEFIFDSPGMYFIFGRVNYANDGIFGGGGDKIRRVMGWVMVRPNIATINPGFSACYVGPDGVCPDATCDCENTLTNTGTSDTEYYGTQGGFYQAKVKMSDALLGTDDKNYYSYYEDQNWFYDNSINTELEDYNNAKALALVQYNSDPTIKASPFTHELEYRIANAEAEEQYHEFIYYQYVKDGLKSDVHQIKITRNLKPAPLYTYRVDCFGHEIQLINQTQFFNSKPYYIKYTWHLGNGERIEMPAWEVLKDETNHVNDWQDVESYEYFTSGEYEPVLEVQYSYDNVEDLFPAKYGTPQTIADENKVCGVRTVYSKKSDLETSIPNVPEGALNYPLTLTASGNAELIVKDNSYEKEAITLPIVVHEIELSTIEPIYKSNIIPNTLGASVASFQDSWVMDLGGEDAIRNLNPFANGQRGLWRGEGAFALIKDRSGAHEITYEAKIDMRESGDFELESFNWQVHTGPNWVKATSITEYSPYGSEIENKDVLDRYSTALFGYNGQLSTAVGANMRHRELAFTSFEEMAIDPSNSGNFVAGVTQSNSGNFNIVNSNALRLRSVNILGGREELAILDYPYFDIETLRNISSITLSGNNLINGGSFTIEDVTVSCKFRDVRSPNQSIVRFSGAGLTALDDAWKGKLSYYEPVAGNTVGNNEIAIVDNEAHTGSRSLAINSDFEQVQNFLDLEEGKEYVISAWVKINTGNAFDATYATAATANENKLGIGIKNQAGEYLGVIEPSGTIIEGWQRLQGKFTYTKGSGLISLRFQKGGYSNVSVYLDDMRFFPNLGNMQSYVYELGTYRLLATLDNNNYATLYSYDSEGNLFLIKKETIEGIKTIQESISHQKGADN